MEIDERAVGRRIARHRARRGLTQEELAGLVGVSLSMMKKIESGERLVTRLPQLLNFAKALRIKDLRELTGVPMPVQADQVPAHPGVTAVHAALMERGHSTPGPLDLDGLDRAVERSWQTWQEASAFRYAVVGQQLPSLIRDVQTAVEHLAGPQRRQALRLATKTYQLARTWTKRVGAHELALLAADRAVTCALEVDDPDLSAAAAWNLAMILSARGEADQAHAVVRRAIEALRPWLAKPSKASLAVYGGLHLLGATEAVRCEQPAEAQRLLDVASSIASKTGETTHFRISFGPTNVDLYRVSAAVELGHTTEALRLAERVPLQSASVVERRLTLRLDAARCYARTKNDLGAIHMLRGILQESAEELRFSVPVRETLAQLKSRAKPAYAAELRALVAAAGMTD